MTIGERGALLRNERWRQRKSLFRVAVETDLHPNTVRNAELGAASEETVETIARALGVVFKDGGP
jgi:hypothetical protein